MSGCGQITEVFITDTDTGPATDTDTDTDGGPTMGTADSTGAPDIDTESESGEEESTGEPIPNPTSRCAGESFEIPDDGTPVETMLEAPDLAGALRLEIGMRVVHPSVSDLHVELEDADGTVYVLLDTPGCDGPNIDAIFGDSEQVGNEQCETDFSAIVGDVSPLDSLGPLLDSAAPGDMWILRATDTAAEDRGSLDNWCIIVDRVPDDA